MTTNKQSGFVIITTVLIMAAGIWVILIGQAGLHLNETLMMQSWRSTNNLSTVANGCAEIAYRGLILDRFFSGQTLSWGANSCIITIIKSGKNYQIGIVANTGNYQKKVTISAVINADKVNINSWQELEY